MLIGFAAFLGTFGMRFSPAFAGSKTARPIPPSPHQALRAKAQAARLASLTAPIMEQAHKAYCVGRYQEAHDLFLRAKAMNPGLRTPSWIERPHPPRPAKPTLPDRQATLAAFARTPGPEFRPTLNALLSQNPADRDVRAALLKLAEMEGNSQEITRHDSVLNPRPPEQASGSWGSFFGWVSKLLLFGLVLWQIVEVVREIRQKP